MHGIRVVVVAVVAAALGPQIHLIGFVLRFATGSVVRHDVPPHSEGSGSPPFLLGNTQKEL